MYLKNSQLNLDLPMPAIPVTCTRCALPSSALARKMILDELELAVAPDEGRLETLRLHQSADAGHDPVSLPELHRFGFALQRMHAGVSIRDRRVGRALGCFADEDAAGFGRGLDARRGVDEVPRHHPLSAGAHVDRRLAGEDAGPRPKLGCAGLGAELGHRVDNLERGADGALRIILLRHRAFPTRP